MRDNALSLRERGQRESSREMTLQQENHFLQDDQDVINSRTLPRRHLPPPSADSPSFTGAVVAKGDPKCCSFIQKDYKNKDPHDSSTAQMKTAVGSVTIGAQR